MSVDVAIVGGGVLGVGLAQAWMERGRRVLLFERYARPSGGSVRNFGLVWPFIAPEGPEWIDRGRRTRELYARLSGQWAGGYEPRGALLAAETDVEAEVCAEFCASAAQRAIDCELLTPRQAVERQPLLRESALRAALWFPQAGMVDPRRFVAGWLNHLAAEGLDFRPGVTVVRVESRGGGAALVAATGELCEARCVVIVGGDELRTLFPQELAAAGLQRCQLEMLQTAPRLGGGPGLAFGRSLRHYPLFARCASFGAMLDERAPDDDALDALGIHLLVKPAADGSLVLGDSHRYQAPDEPPDFDHDARIERWLLDLAERRLSIPRPSVERRWLGYYARHAQQPIVVLEPQPNVWLASGLTSGMSVGYGWAEDFVAERESVA